MEDREESIYVSARLRTLNEKEKNDVADWECVNDTTIIYNNVNSSPMFPSVYTFGMLIHYISLFNRIHIHLFNCHVIDLVF